MSAEDRVLITRDSADSSTLGRRCYVTGPHFSQDIYSSTFDRSKATTYSRTEAERLVYTKWRSLNPQIEDLEPENTDATQ